jgi:predicted nucleotidyltransferase
MEGKITILKPFFEDPAREYHIRELSRLLRINHTTVRQKLRQLANEGFISAVPGKLYSAYRSNTSKKYLNLKRYYNLEKIRISGIIEALEQAYDYPAIVLFGSYATANDDKKSDIDLCVIGSISNEFNAERYENILNRKVSIQKFSREKWKKMAKNNKALINSICNGIVLSGQLEAIP